MYDINLKHTVTDNHLVFAADENGTCVYARYITGGLSTDAVGEKLSHDVELDSARGITEAKKMVDQYAKKEMASGNYDSDGRWIGD